MKEEVNFSELFIETHNEYINKYKKNNKQIKKHDAQKRYLSFLEFVRNHSYWSRYNLDYENKNNKSKYLESKLSGKYLNEIHQFLVKRNFYKTLYSKVLNEYLKITNYQTLKQVTVDSFFVRNILGENLRRNKFYSNKSGIKVHLLVDSRGVVLAVLITDGTVNDSVTIADLLKNLLIDREIFDKHIDIFLADSSYSGFANIIDLTNSNFRVIMGRNKQHTKKTDDISEANPTQIETYKTRTIIENTNGHIERYPILLNNYEHNTKSYEGLLFFALASILNKRINCIIRTENDIEFKNEEANKKSLKDIYAKERKQKLYESRQREKQIKELEEKERAKHLKDIENKINDKIWNKVNKDTIKKSYDKNICNNIGTRKYSYQKYEAYIKKGIYNHVKNNVLIKPYSYAFGKKTLYIVDVSNNAFSEENITNIMNDINQINKINDLCETFFIT